MTENNSKRLGSLDALRGFDMLLISGLSGLVIEICNLFPGGGECWLESQMHHAQWDGFTLMDTIFPLFIFLAGVSFPFSYAKSIEKGYSKRKIYGKAFLRAAILILLGMVCNGLLKFEHFPMRFYSVLERIGVTGLVSSILFINFKTRTRAIIAAATLLIYWGLSLIVAPDAPAGASSFSMEGSFAAYLDRNMLPDSMIYKPGVYEPEGFLSTFPAIVTAMLGNFTGQFIRESRYDGNRKSLVMLLSGAAMLAVGLVWSHWLPVNKKLWSSSYVLVVGAYSLIMFASFYWIMDVKEKKKWAFPLKVIGMNSILIYMLPRIVDFRSAVDFFFGGLMNLTDPTAGKIIYWLGYILFGWLILFLCYRKKIFLKV